MHETNVTFIQDRADWVTMSLKGSAAAGVAWRAALDAADEFEDELPLDTLGDGGIPIREEYQNHFADFGAWSRDEIESWSDRELRATLIQGVAHQIDSGDDTQLYEDEDGELWFTVDGWAPKSKGETK